MKSLLYSCNEGLIYSYNFLYDTISTNISKLRIVCYNNDIKFNFDHLDYLTIIYSIMLFFMLISCIVSFRIYRSMLSYEKRYHNLYIQNKVLYNKNIKLKCAILRINDITTNNNERSAKRISLISSEINKVFKHLRKT